MTRINLVDPAMLTNKHLMAEYREIPRVFTAVRKLCDEPSPRVGDGWRKFIEGNSAPCTYKLGAGHVKFFYTRLPWLRKRYVAIAYELRTKREFKLDNDERLSILRGADILIDGTRLDQNRAWQPTRNEIYLNMARLVKRSNIPAVMAELKEDS